MENTAENARFTVTTEEVDRDLIRALDRAVDDLEAGREYTIEEGMKKMREIRARRN